MLPRLKSAARSVITVAVTAGVAVAVAAGTAGSASAAQYVSTPTGGVIWLTHAETVAAARSGLATYISTTPGVAEHVGVYMRPDSRYRQAPHRIPGKPGLFVTVRTQNLVAETAAHPTGRIGILINTRNPNVPVTVAQYWSH